MMYRLHTIRQPLSVLCTRNKFTLDPSDLVFQNVIGSGPGGTKMASTRNKVVVKHTPTNIVVQCHDTRSLEQNKNIAIRRLTEKVELHLFGPESSVAVKKAKQLEGYEERKQAKKEEAAARIAADKLKREEAEVALRKKIDEAMSTGLPYLRDNVSDIAAESEDIDLKSGSENSTSDYSNPDTKIFRDTAQKASQDTLKSLFGASTKKK
ncbi:hypothetical protein ACHWQZ_G008245 [Mnemiopsis leidyi]